MVPRPALSPPCDAEKEPARAGGDALDVEVCFGAFAGGAGNHGFPGGEIGGRLDLIGDAGFGAPAEVESMGARGPVAEGEKGDLRHRSDVQIVASAIIKFIAVDGNEV